MAFRCHWPSCKALRFESKASIATHSKDHLHSLLALAEQEAKLTCQWHACKRKTKAFQTLGALNKHLKDHVKDHWCSYEGCREAFARGSDLMRHERTKHSEERAFPCPVDGCTTDGFPRKDKLDRHIRERHTVFRCDLAHCDALAAVESEMEDHFTRCHTGDKLYECSMGGCDGTSSKFSSDTLRRHLRRHHNLSDRTAVQFVHRAEQLKRLAPTDSWAPSWIRFGPCNQCVICNTATSSFDNNP
jgi:uncharacterized Zn-finger protein